MVVVVERVLNRTRASILSALTALTLHLKWPGGSLARSAPPERGTGDQPSAKAVPAGATIVVAHSRPGEGIARTVLSELPGILALTHVVSPSVAVPGVLSTVRRAGADDHLSLLDCGRPSRPPRSASRMTKSMASTTMPVLILERPTCRS